MKILLLYNASARRCGFANYGVQTEVALRRAGCDVTVWDGDYPVVYARQQIPGTVYLGLFPPDVARYDVIHIIWHAATMNHYAGADWAGLRALPGGGPLVSWLDGGPSNTFCPFAEHMQVKWSSYPREGYHLTPFPIPDWVTELPAPDPVFTVGMTTVRGDGIGRIINACAAQGWATNLPTPDQWLSLDDEVRRLARSTVNVCWYSTPPLWKDRAGAPSTALASHRPLLVNADSLLGHLVDYPDLYHGQYPDLGGPDLEAALQQIHADWQAGTLRMPSHVLDDLSWTRAAAEFVRVWQHLLWVPRG